MDFFDAHWVEIFIGVILLWASISVYKISRANDEAEMAAVSSTWILCR
jgi:hypothetical protein